MKISDRSSKSLSPRANALLAAGSTFAAPAIAAAMAKQKEEQAKQAAEKAATVLRNADAMLQSYVAHLQACRKAEKEAKAQLVKFDKAFADFIKHGDVEKLAKDTGISAHRFQY